QCGEASDDRAALEAAGRDRYDLVLFQGVGDWGAVPGEKKPSVSGPSFPPPPIPNPQSPTPLKDVCRRIRERTSDPHVKIVVVAEGSGPLPGVDELVPPGDPRQLLARVRQCLAVKVVQDRAARLSDQL